MPSKPLRWDIFCHVIDNLGDVGVCWRLARELATRGQRVRLWLDRREALDWMAPELHTLPIDLRAWPAAGQGPDVDAPADVLIEAFGCDLDPRWVQTLQPEPARAVWINLEYLSAERYVERSHGLPSPVLHGPLLGRTRWFFYPGFSSASGGLLREADLPARRASFEPHPWLAQRLGVEVAPDTPLLSLFCYQPPGLPTLLQALRDAPRPHHLLVTPGHATRAVAAALNLPAQAGTSTHLGALRLSWLPWLSQDDYDALLWACDFNFVRGEDSWVRAHWAARPMVWQPYVQDDGAHAPKLQAWLDWLDAPPDMRAFHLGWSGLAPPALALPDWRAWQNTLHNARQRLLAQDDLVTQLQVFVDGKR